MYKAYKKISLLISDVDRGEQLDSKRFQKSPKELIHVRIEFNFFYQSQNVGIPETFSRELQSLLEGLLQRDINNRLGCRGNGADELKAHPFFNGIDWQQVYLLKYTPPLIPPRGEVNAADAFDIGSFDEEDTKGIKLTEADQDLYKNFPLVISERWQTEVAETVFETINNEADKVK